MPTVRTQFQVPGKVPLAVRVTPAREQNWWVALVVVGLAAVLGFGWLIATHVADSSATKAAVNAALVEKAAADAATKVAADTAAAQARADVAARDAATRQAAAEAADKARQEAAVLKRAADEAAAQERQRIREEAAARQQQAAAQRAAPVASRSYTGYSCPYRLPNGRTVSGREGHGPDGTLGCWRS